MDIFDGNDLVTNSDLQYNFFVVASDIGKSVSINVVNCTLCLFIYSSELIVALPKCAI